MVIIFNRHQFVDGWNQLNNFTNFQACIYNSKGWVWVTISEEMKPIFWRHLKQKLIPIQLQKIIFRYVLTLTKILDLATPSGCSTFILKAGCPYLLTVRNPTNSGENKRSLIMHCKLLSGRQPFQIEGLPDLFLC